jgi:7,8-dihydroneopterin aldolase/epimerase/oxygenase
MSKIRIADLEVFYCIGVSDEERAKPQRLLLTLDLSVDISSAAVSDRIEKTINYHTLAQELLSFGEGRSWKLVEKLASNIADMVVSQYKPDGVMVEVKKFAIPEARYVAVSVARSRAAR